MKNFCITAIIFVFVTVSSALAQSTDEEKIKDSNHEHYTYFKLGFTYTQVDIGGFSPNTNGFNLEAETYFSSNHIGLSGWAIGYRKKYINFFEAGHFIDSRVFRQFNFLPGDIALKTGFGVEWGIAPLVFGKTRYYYQNGNLIAYEHLFQHRNSGIPWYSTEKDAVLNPVFNISVSKTAKRLMLEIGIRANIKRFGLDRYEVGDEFKFSSQDSRVIIPAGFVSIGVRIG